MSPVALILGAGSKVGASVAQKLKAEGYKVAVASRSSSQGDTGIYPFQIDLSDPEKVPALFDSVTKQLGEFPSVVVYNAYALTMTTEKGDPLAIPVAAISKDFQVNTVSLWAAAQESIKGWKTLGADIPKALIFTGNVLPFGPIPEVFSIGIGKAASAHIIEGLAKQYGGDGYRFYFAYQVGTDGGLSFGIDGDAAAKTYHGLVQRKEQGNWHVKFDTNAKDWSE